MRKIFENFYKCSVIAIIATFVGMSFTDAAVTPRQTNANKAAAARVPNRIATSAPKKSATTTPEPEPEPEPVVVTEPEPEPEKPIVVDNKASMFQDVLSEIGASTTDRAAQERADMIRRQREQLMQQDAQSTAGTTNMGSANACDAGLRQCMMEKCGDGFTKCANDSTVIWNTKIDSCRNKTKCSAHEYTLLAPEILADRDLNVQLAHYDAVIDCGNKYNTCIFGQCGTTLEKCLSKKDGDAAISKCATIANECKSMDNGLASRVMSVFGDLRKIASARVPKDEKRLYELRDLMRAQCNRLGAAFDERTLDCVYTVSFFAGEDRTLMASKKLYPAQSFQCNPNWFGIDITTFRENAYRLTRAQRSASSAMLGAGVGTAAGLIASGAIDRAIKTQRAEKAVKEECESHTGYKWNGKDCVDADGNPINLEDLDTHEDDTSYNTLNFRIDYTNGQGIQNATVSCKTDTASFDGKTDIYGNVRGLKIPKNITGEDIKGCLITADGCPEKNVSIAEIYNSNLHIILECQPQNADEHGCNTETQEWSEEQQKCVRSRKQIEKDCNTNGFEYDAEKNTCKPCPNDEQHELTTDNRCVMKQNTVNDMMANIVCNRKKESECTDKCKWQDGKCIADTENTSTPTSAPNSARMASASTPNDNCTTFCNNFNPSEKIVAWYTKSPKTLYDEPTTNSCVSDSRCKQKTQQKCETLVGQSVYGLEGAIIKEAWAHDIKEGQIDGRTYYYYGCKFKYDEPQPECTNICNDVAGQLTYKTGAKSIPSGTTQKPECLQSCQPKLKQACLSWEGVSWCDISSNESGCEKYEIGSKQTTFEISGNNYKCKFVRRFSEAETQRQKDAQEQQPRKIECIRGDLGTWDSNSNSCTCNYPGMKYDGTHCVCEGSTWKDRSAVPTKKRGYQLYEIEIACSQAGGSRDYYNDHGCECPTGSKYWCEAEGGTWRPLKQTCDCKVGVWDVSAKRCTSDTCANDCKKFAKDLTSKNNYRRQVTKRQSPNCWKLCGDIMAKQCQQINNNFDMDLTCDNTAQACVYQCVQK